MKYKVSYHRTEYYECFIKAKSKRDAKRIFNSHNFESIGEYYQHVDSGDEIFDEAEEAE